MKRSILGLLVLGIALVPFASRAMTTGPDINYVSQTGSTVTADYFGLPANSQLIFVNNSTGATTTSVAAGSGTSTITVSRSEEHTSELQSQSNLVCRLLLEKKNDHRSHHLH